MKGRAKTIGIDTGGTFTDLVLVDGDEVRVAKVTSTPDDPARAIEEGLRRLGGTCADDHVVHGTTVALNALLTGKVARVALVTNEGFRHLIEIGRQDRPNIYALQPAKSAPLVPRELRFEIAQRTWPTRKGDGFETAREPGREELEELARSIRAAGAEAVAVCLLHSWAVPEIETRVASALDVAGLPVTTSAGILPEHREYERFSTAIVNAALTPLMRNYLGNLVGRIGGARLSVLQSNGGTLAAERAAREPVRVVLSGPAGGVVGAATAVREAGLGAFVGLDMGGTSTDVAFHAASDAERKPHRALEPVHVGGHPIGVPALDIHTIGCGGGSLVSIDSGGILHVGPASAGADPGPVCYGKSAAPTVTDAHVLLGHIAEGPFLSGGLKLDQAAVQAAFERIGRQLGTDAVDAASGVLDVARAAMRRAIGVMTMQRGQDPENLPLVAFGGAGGLHAAALAESLHMQAALVPHAPGALSAFGMCSADALRDASRTVLEPLERWSSAARAAVYEELRSTGRDGLIEAGFGGEEIEFEEGLDLRYRGQSYEIHLTEEGEPDKRFHGAHAELFGYSLEERDVELVALRVRARIRRAPRAVPVVEARELPADRVGGERDVVFDRVRKTALIERAVLEPGHRFSGPALVEEYSGTTLVPPGWTARVTAGGHLLLKR